jgi:hypothetical protein
MFFLMGSDLGRSARPRLGSKSAALLKLAFVALDTGAAHTKALSNRVDRGAHILKGIDDPLTKIYRVGLHDSESLQDQC